MSEESPCIGVCMMDDNGFCIGCGRTQAEIDGWPAEGEGAFITPARGEEDCLAR